ncbi:hypothetical protein MYAM1_000967 [Malassezia yamatoensis]|uniref:Uncharacterized protein n=1 Tax=Malassezia yamatoensis TaxID=253288 RepID=A0AAJ5YV78_9BASI|nr:hypothetical protein MYAM1_000967 [Malassezia yamatoensis]
MNQGQAEARLETTSDIINPSLLPSIVPRIRRIARLIDNSQSSIEDEHPDREVDENDEMEISEVFEPLSSSLALGAIGDDDNMDLWNQWDRDTHTTSIPSTLLAELAQEANALRATFEQTQAVISAMPGGDMSVDDQKTLILRLENYVARQE